MSASNIAQDSIPFLEKVMRAANLQDIYEARDLSEVVYRTMRDLMPKDAIERVGSELDKPAISTDDKTLQDNIADLWKDRNPIVSWLSKVRPPFDTSGAWGIDEQRFITRIEQEGGMPNTTRGETVVKAVFSATKEELSRERVQEIAGFLPGKIKQLWNEA